MKNTQVAIGFLLIVAANVSAQKAKKAAVINKAAATPVIWVQPAIVTAADMTFGPGSKEGAPKPFPDGTYHFVKEEIKSTFAKIEVKDALGHKYKVKFGNGGDSKSHSEVASNRLLYAFGFRSREIYYVPAGMLDTFKPGDPKSPKLHSKMGGKLTKDAAGHFHFTDVSFTAKKDDAEGEDTWGYEDTNLPASISKSPQLSWLKIFDVLVGNWDTARKNHAVYYVKNKSGTLDAWYQDKDVGTGFGKNHASGGLLRVRPTRWKLKDYQNEKFVVWDNGGPNKEIAGSYLKFYFDVSSSMENAKEVKAACSSVPKADAKAFVEQVLDKVPTAAIREAFRTAGADNAEVEGFTTALLGRIQELRVASGAK